MTTAQKSRQITFTEALHEALDEEMARDPKVFLMGEDVQRGLFGVSAGLFAKYGAERIMDMPLQENSWFGAAVGAAACGMRPIVEVLSSFTFVAFDELINQAAKMRYMFGGQVNLPVTFRFAEFYDGGLAAHHSDRPHPIFLNIPGFKVAFPSNPVDGKGLLKTAIRMNDPVIFWEDRKLLNVRQEVPGEEYAIPFGVADVKREGTDVTVCALGALVNLALDVAKKLEAEDISVEVVDPRTLVPLDKKTILDSVGKTGRFVAADMAHKTCSFASELCAMVAEQAFWSLKAPVQRVASMNVHIPFSPALEPLVYPNEEKLIAAIRRTLS